MRWVTAIAGPLLAAITAFVVGAWTDTLWPPLVAGALIAGVATFAICVRQRAGDLETVLLTVFAICMAVVGCLFIRGFALSNTS